MSFDIKIKSGDISINNDGTIESVVLTTKLVQDIQKIILTEKGSNKFYDFYGSDVGSLRIGMNDSSDLVEKNLQVSVQQALTNLMFLQQSQLQYQLVDPSEHILKINSVKAFRDLTDPRLYNVLISVTTLSNKTIEDSISVKIV